MGWKNLCVDSGLGGGEETMIFGPRKETGSSLYQIDTLATITSAEEGKGSPKLMAISKSDGICLALESNIVMFDESCCRHSMTVSFDKVISAVAWTDDSRFLAVAESCTAALHLVHLQTETKLTMHLDNIISSPSTITSMSFTDGKAKDELILDLIISNGQHVRLSGVMHNQLHNAVKERNAEEIKKIQKNIQQSVFDVSNLHEDHCECILQADSYQTLEKDNLFIAGTGKSALSVWSTSNGNVDALLTAVPFFLEQGSGIVKFRISRNEDYLITLNTEGHLAVWNLMSFEIMDCWFDLEIQDFVLFSSNLLEQDKPSGSVSEDLKVVIITKEQNKKSLLQVYTLPHREHVYTLQVCGSSKLANLDENQDCIFFIEGVEREINDSFEDNEFLNEESLNVETIRIRCLTEAFPENRFSRLLYKKHFDKAEAFAEEFNLDVQLVYKVKANFLLDELLPLGSTQSVNVSNWAAVAEQLKSCLHKIKDLEYVINCCLKAQLPTFQATYDMLMYGKEYFENFDTNQNTSSPAVQSLLEGLNRLVTFKVAFGLKKFSGNVWNSFLNASIFDEVCSCFLTNQFGPGILLWRRHQKEFEDEFSTAKLTELLKSISANVPSERIIPWLREDFVPFVLTVLPAGQGILAQWLCERARAMEFNETNNWPHNALEMADVMFKAFQEVAKTKHGRGFMTPEQFATQICKVSKAFGSQEGNSSNKDGESLSPMCQLSELVKGLEEVVLLHSRYSCKLSFDEYYKETTWTIAFKLLDRVPAAELIPNTIECYVKPYARNHNFKLDNLLSGYIENMLINGKKDNVFREAKIVAIISSISSPELRCKATLHFMRKASIPWSDEVHSLVERVVKENPGHADLQQQLKLAEVKKILLGYGVSIVSFNTSDTAKIEGVVRSIIKTDEATSLADGLKIAEMYFTAPEKKVYFFQLSSWLLNNKAEECCRFLRTIPIEKATKAGSEVISYVLACLEDQPVDKEDEEMLQVVTEGAIDILRTLSILDESFRIENAQVATNLKNILALQKEYGIYLSLDQYSDELKRESLFNKYITKIKNESGQGKDIRTEEQKIRRIADLLRCHPLFMRHLLERAFASSNRETETDRLFMNLCKGVPSQETLYLLKRVVLSFLLESASNLGINGLSVWAKYVEKFYDVSCFALTVCRPDDIIDFFEMSRSLGMSLAVSSQFESNDYEEDLQGNMDQFGKQGLAKFFADDGLILNANEVIPLLTNLNIASFDPHCSVRYPLTTRHISGWSAAGRYQGEPSKYPILNLFDCSQKLCRVLYENNLCTRALQYITQCLGNLRRHYYIIHGKFEIPADLLSKDFASLVENLRKNVVEIVPKITDNVESLEKELFWKVLQHRHVDHDFALGIMCSMQQGSSVLCLTSIKEHFGSRFSRIQSAAKVGRDFAALSGNQKLYEEFKTIEDSSLWGKRFQAMKIPCKDTFFLHPSSKSALAKKLVAHKDVTINLIQEFCEAFSIDLKDVYCLYLKTLLIPPMAVRQFVFSDHVEKLKSVMEISVAGDMVDIVQFLNECLPRVSPYDYERLRFVLWSIKRALTQPKQGVEKGILLLEVLENYQRKVPPTHTETSALGDVDEEEFIRGEHSDASLAAKRLPFHFLMDSQPWKLITTELVSTEAVAQIEPIVRALSLSIDQLYSVAIYEIGTKALGNSPTNTDRSGKKNANLRYEVMEEMLKKIKNPEMLIAAAKWVAKMLPMGEGKVRALTFCVETAEKWATDCGPELISKVKETYHRFNDLLKRIHTESVLLEHNVQEESFLSLSSQPATLICRLYEVFGSDDGITEGKISAVQNINQLVAKVARINHCSLEKLEGHLLEKWLFSSTQGSQSEPIDADVTLQADVSMLITDEGPKSTEEDNLKRVIYMLRGRLPACIIDVLTSLKPSETSYSARYSHKIRSMQAIFTMVPASTIEETMKKSIDHIREEFICFVYLRELEALHMSQTAAAFYKCNKEGLVKGLWRNHSHEAMAVRLITDLCIDYKIYDPQLWNVLLPQLLSFGMVEYLTHVLVSVSGVPELRELPCLPKMWKNVISAPLETASPPLSDEDEKNCFRAAHLLQRCPVILSLNVLEFHEHFKRVQLYVQALMCIYLIPDILKRNAAVKRLLQSGGITIILSDINRQREKYGANWQIDEMEEEIYTFVYDHSLFADLLGTKHVEKMIPYLIKTNRVGKIILMCLKMERMQYAFYLLRSYVKEYPKSQTALSAIEHNLDDFQTLMVFLDQEELLAEATPYLPIDDDEE